MTPSGTVNVRPWHALSIFGDWKDQASVDCLPQKLFAEFAEADAAGPSGHRDQTVRRHPGNRVNFQNPRLPL